MKNKKLVILTIVFLVSISRVIFSADTTKAGYKGGQPIPSGDEIVDLESAYNIHGDDGIDDSSALQQAINEHKNSGHIVVLLLPKGQIDISGPAITYKDGTGIDGGGIYIDGDGIIIRGRGIDPITGTRVVYNHNTEDIYSVNNNIPNIDGKIWPGLAVFQVETRETSSGYEEYPGSVNFHWKLGKKLRSSIQPGTNGNFHLYLNKESDANLFSVNQTVWVAACNTMAFLTNHFTPSQYWENSNYLARNQMFHIMSIHKNGNNDTYVTLDEPLEFDITYSDGGEIYGSTKYSKIVPVHLIRNVGFEDFTFYHSLAGTEYSDLNERPYDASTNPNGVGFRYVNMAPKQAIHTILFKYCEDVWVKNVKVEMSGSHPIVTEVVEHATFKDNILLGSWNKGKGGMGYFRGSKAFECLFENNFISMVRHLSFQWSSTGNVSRHNIFWHAGDMNFHAGWERYNLVEHIWSELKYEHQSWNDEGTGPEGGTWFPLWWGAAPHGSKWAGVGSGPHNEVKDSVFYKQRTAGGIMQKWGHYDTPGISYIFGWNGTEWRHLNTDGDADGDNIIQTWEDNQLYDFTAPGKGVYTTGASFVDTTPPTLSIISPTNYSRFTNNFYIQGTASDDVACKILISVDTQSNHIAWGMVNWRKKIFITNLSYGLHTATISAIDGENNITIQTLYFYVGPETHKPLIIKDITVQQTNNGSGFTLIRYKGIDTNNNLCFYRIKEYSTNNIVWMPMTVVMTDARNTGEPLHFTTIGSLNTIVWDTKTDIGHKYDATIWIRLQGTNSITNSDINTNGPFSIDNQQPNVVVLYSPTNMTETNNTKPYFVWSVANDDSSIGHYDFVIDTTNTNVLGNTNYTPLNPLTYATHYWKVRAVDMYGNKGLFSAEYGLTIFTNNLGPNVPVISHIVAQQTNDGSGKVIIRFTGNVQIGTNDCTYVLSQYSLDNSLWWSMSSDTNDSRYTDEPLKFSVTGNTMTYVWNSQSDVSNIFDNSVFVRFQVSNGTTNSFISNSISFVIDNKSPGIVSLNMPSDNAVTTNLRPSFTWIPPSEDSGISIYNLVIDGETNDVVGTSFIPSTNFLEGVHTWQVRAIDLYGNIGEYSINRTFFIDRTPPDHVLLNSPISNMTVTNTTIIFQWYSVDDTTTEVSNYIIQISDNSNFSSVNNSKITNGTNYIVSGLTNDTYYWRVRAYDVVGNTNDWSSVWIVSIDTNQTIPTIYTPANNTISSITNPVFVWSLESGISSNQIVIWNAKGTYTNTFSTNTNYMSNLSELTEGTNTWKIRVYKTNTQQWQLWSEQWIYILDTTPPEAVTNLHPANGQITDDTTPSFSWSPVSDGNYYEIVIDGFTNIVTNTSFILTNELAIGSHIWQVGVIDKAGNAKYSAERTLTIQVGSGMAVNTFKINPNPLFENETMEIEFGVEAGAEVQFEIYTMVGSHVITIIPEDVNSGRTIWKGENEGGKEVASGIYLMIMRVNGKKVGKVLKIGYIRNTKG